LRATCVITVLTIEDESFITIKPSVVRESHYINCNKLLKGIVDGIVEFDYDTSNNHDNHTYAYSYEKPILLNKINNNNNATAATAHW